jgi:hypothetical protein
LHLNNFLLNGKERTTMDSLYPSFLPAINQYSFLSILFLAGVLIKPSYRTNSNECPVIIARKKLVGSVRSLRDQLGGSGVENKKLFQDGQKWRSVAEKRNKMIASLHKDLKSSSFRIHQLERKLLERSRHRH